MGLLIGFHDFTWWCENAQLVILLIIIIGLQFYFFCET